MEDYFSQYGKIAKCVVMRDPNTNDSRGFGFVTFTDSQDMAKCLQESPHMIDGRQVGQRWDI